MYDYEVTEHVNTSFDLFVRKRIIKETSDGCYTYSISVFAFKLDENKNTFNFIIIDLPYTHKIYFNQNTEDIDYLSSEITKFLLDNKEQKNQINGNKRKIVSL